MKLAKPILVAALALAASVLFPMRKAQAALARTQTTAATVSSPRPPSRRRPSGPQQVIKRQPIGQQTPNVTCRAAGGTATAPRDSGPSAHDADHLVQSTPQAHAPAAAADSDSIVDRVDYALRPQPTGTALPTTHLVVNARFVDDIPKPPPKTAAL
jgi:hypothetical protein